jgi:hypothetical protein
MSPAAEEYIASLYAACPFAFPAAAFMRGAASAECLRTGARSQMEPAKVRAHFT